MQTITIDPRLGAASVGLRFPTPQVITYRLRVYAPNGTDTLLDISGDNRTNDNATYDLPPIPASETGCTLLCTVTIIDPDKAGNPYSIQLEVDQIDPSTNLPVQRGTLSIDGTTTYMSINETVAAVLTRADNV